MNPEINLVVGGYVNAADAPDGERIVRAVVVFYDQEPEEGDAPREISLIMDEATAVAFGTLLIQHTRGYKPEAEDTTQPQEEAE